MREDEWTWYQLDTSIVREYGSDRRELNAAIRKYILFTLDTIGGIQDHVYDGQTGMENMHIHNEIIRQVPNLHKELTSLGWKVKKLEKEDAREKKEFYEALMKGGNIDPKKGMH